MRAESDPPIVGIGASAGGVAALQAFFEALPEHVDAAFVVVVHLDPDARSQLGAVLASHTQMTVTQAEGKAKLERGHIYVIPPNRRLEISGRRVSSLPFEEARHQRAPVDLFFRSLAESHGDGAYAIVLSGAGADGAVGVKAIKEAGGIVLVQDPAEAEYASMPRGAIAAGVSDFVLPVRGLARQLTELLADGRRQISSTGAQNDEEWLRRILAHLRVRIGHDFSLYKRATILRRIARRMQVTRKDTLADYYLSLRDNGEEAQALFSDLLISVTTFFRDSHAFAVLQREVVPHLFDGKEAGGGVRVWVPGCASGEEAYSIGILLLEEAARREWRPDIQVFGSDLDVGALAVAREGVYPATIEADLSEERLNRFFQREGDHYRVRRELRDVVLFASHSVLRDPPFSRLDMISCRNLLIYLDRELQQQVCSTFHYALNPGGFLFLGASESAEQPPGLFRTVDRDARVHRALLTVGEKRPALPILLGPRHLPAGEEPASRIVPPGIHTGDAALHRQMLERIAPPSMLVDESLRAVHLSDNAGRFLHLSGGPITTDATEVVREELRFELRTALHRAFERREATLSMPISVQFDNTRHRVYLQVKPVLQDKDPARYALVLFIEGEAVDEPADDVNVRPRDAGSASETVKQLQEELQLAHHRLRATREESEAANEELRAANEELQSINEEYRSTSEELETSKEELQSINEELQTVNNELKLKLESVSRAHSDLQNLMAATDFGTLFLDPSLRIKRFTPRLTELFNITISDEGRPITDFTHQLDYAELADHARAVLKDLVPVQHEVPGRNGGWYLVRIRPYRTVDDKIDGVVATFVDITERRDAESALRESEARLRQETRLVDLSRSPIFVWDFDGGVLQWNRGSEELYGYSHEEVLGKHKETLLQTVVPGSSFKELRESLLREGTWSGQLLHRTKAGRVLTVESRIELVKIGERRLVLESTWDVTERMIWEKRRQLLLNELNHRVGNTLAVVQSMARQTLRTAGSPEAFVDLFEGRLGALANAHKLLVEGRWEGAEFGEIAHSQLEAYTGQEPPQLAFEGKKVTLPPEYAMPLGLVLHELATNAVKYGALSVDTGRVSVKWGEERKDGKHLFKVRWQEVGGPPVVAPVKRGFGGVLIEQSLPDAAVQREFLPQGLICTIVLQLPEDKNNGTEDCE